MKIEKTHEDGTIEWEVVDIQWLAQQLNKLGWRIDALEQEVARLKQNKPRYGSADTTAIPRFTEERMEEIEDDGA